MTVGSVVLRMDDTNPADIYGGTWELITGDASLTFGNGSNQAGIISGDNDPTVPLIEHSHTMNHDHPSVNTNTDTHSHTLTLKGRAGSQWTVNRGANWGMDDASPGSATATTAGDSHYHSVNLPNYTGNTGNAGQSNAKLDVRGARIAINVWKRVG